jgi:cell division protein FtsQ
VARGQNRRTAVKQPGEAARRLRRAVALSLPTVIALAAIVGAGWATWEYGVRGDLLRIHEIRYLGLSQIPASALAELSPIRPGDHLLFSDTEVMARALRRNPWVATVEINRRLPPALEVVVTERQAAALVDLGGLYLVDSSGQVYKRAGPGDGLDLPIVTGLEREAFEEHRDESGEELRLRSALGLLGRWRETGLDRRAAVSEVHLDPVLGTTVYAGDDGMEIRLGQGDLPRKLERLDVLLARLESDGVQGEVIHLDNRRHPDWVAVRVKGRTGVVVDGRGPRGP